MQNYGIHSFYMTLLAVTATFAQEEGAKPIYMKRGGALVTPAFQNPIKPSDLDQNIFAGQSMKKLKHSGRYYVSQDLLASPANNNISIFEITANNVALDLNNKTIDRLVGGGSGTGLTAIKVASSSSNVRLQNGFIQGTNKNSQNIEIGINVAASSRYVVIEDIKINQCTTNGIIAASTNNLTIANTMVTNCSGSAALTALSLTSCNDVVVKNVFCNNNTTTSGPVVGMLLSSCQNVSVSDFQGASNSTVGGGSTAYGIQISSSQDCDFTNCKVTNSTAVTNAAGMFIDTALNCVMTNVDGSLCSGGSAAYSFNLSTCESCVFTNCLGNKNTSSSGACVGFLLGSSAVNSFANCQANKQSATGGEAIGFDIQSGSSNCIFSNCQANENNALSAAQLVYGFKLAADDCTVLNCAANRNATVGTGGAAYGIYLSSASNNRIDGCQTNNNISAASDAYGVYLTSSNNNAVLNSQAKGNTTDSADQESVGYFSSGGSANRFENCVANGQTCSGTATAVTHLAAGFKFQSNESRSYILDCEAAGNNGGAGANARAYGIFFSGTSAATDCVVRRCFLSQNTTSHASSRHYGFYDATTDTTTTVLLDNVSIAHGKCLTSATLDASNQFIDTEDTGMNYFYNHAGSGDDPHLLIAEAPRHALTSISTSVGGWENISLY